MPVNKQAVIRYHTLDKCFSNTGRKYFIEDLIDACCDALAETNLDSNGVSRSQIFADIRFMESEQGWSIPLKKIREAKRVYYRYSDPHFSIRNMGISSSEAEKIKETLLILSRFKGLPHFEWIQEMFIRVQNIFQFKETPEDIVGFEENPFLRGLEHFNDLFEAIRNKVVLRTEYKSYQEGKLRTFYFHPWYLKQYNNRWFVFGVADQNNNLTNLAIDRIIAFKKTNISFRENTNIDFSEFFEDTIGVSVNQSGNPVTIILKLNTTLWPYIESKPLHGSQRVIEKSPEFVKISIQVQINYELLSILFSHMDKLEVLEPQYLRNDMNKIAQSIVSNYA